MVGHDDSVAVLVMVIMIAVITQLPSTSHGMVMYNNTISSATTTTILTTTSSSTGTAGNDTWCNGHISINGECLQLNIKKNINNIADDDVEGDELEFDMELKYAMMEMVDMYSDSTAFITRFLAGGGGGGSGKSKNPNKAYCDQGDNRYRTECQGDANGGKGDPCKDIHKRTC